MKLSKERERRFETFGRWLRQNCHLGEWTIKTIIGRCKRVERALPTMTEDGDLDASFDNDGLEGVLQKLGYFTEDVHNQKEPPSGIVFRVNHSDPRYYEKVKEGLNSLHSAIKLYRGFCCENSR